MARDFFGIEKGLDLYAENGALLIRVLSGTAAPDGLGDQAAAPIGSLYARSGVGELYNKILNNGNSADWKLTSDAAVTIGRWRGAVKAVTADTVAVGVRDLVANPFSDDDAPTLAAADFVVGDFVIGGSASTPVLLEVTAVSAPNVTFAAPLIPIAAEDTFICDNYLPNPSALENKAIVNFNGSVVVKVSDINWGIATGINVSGTYAASSGNPLANDTVEVVLQKLDGNIDAVNTLTGVAQGGTTLGTWSSPVDLLFAASASIKAIFQRIGELLMQFRGVQSTGITTITTVDSVPVASVKCVKWLVTAFEEATPANASASEVFALNNTSSADDTIFAKLKLGSAFNLSLTVDVSGGNMRLRAASTTGGVTVTARRLEVVKSVL